MTRRSIATIALLYLLVLSSYLILAHLPFTEERLHAVVMEDGPVEWIGAIAFLVASVFFCAAFLNSTTGPDPARSKRQGRNLFYLLLTLLFFFAFGEEISWGQRIFGWATPATLQAANLQHETNLHNLPIVSGLKADHAKIGGLESLLSVDRLFAIFWIGFCVFIPLLNKLSSRAHSLLERIRFPVPPLWIGILLLCSREAEGLVKHGLPRGSVLRTGIGELRETNTAVIFAALALCQWLSVCQRRTESTGTLKAAR
jgi:hypothetical protein